MTVLNSRTLFDDVIHHVINHMTSHVIGHVIICIIIIIYSNYNNYLISYIQFPMHKIIFHNSNFENYNYVDFQKLTVPIMLTQ